jgi:hypothetical protein
MNPRTSRHPSMDVTRKNVEEEYGRTEESRRRGGTLTLRAVSSVQKSYLRRSISTNIPVPTASSEEELSPTFFRSHKRAGNSSPSSRHPDDKDGFEIRRGAGHDNENIRSEYSKDLLRRASNFIGRASLTLSASKKSDLLYSHDPTRLCRGRVLFSGTAAQEHVSANFVSPFTHFESESRKRDPPASSDRKIIVKDPPGSVSETTSDTSSSTSTDTIFSSFEEQELQGALVPLQQSPYCNPYAQYPDPDIHLSILSNEDDSLVLSSAPLYDI